MTKHFCDGCGQELTKEMQSGLGVGREFKLKSEPYKSKKMGFISVKVSLCASQENCGEFCKYCIIDAIAECDDRPKEAKR